MLLSKSDGETERTESGIKPKKKMQIRSAKITSRKPRLYEKDLDGILSKTFTISVSREKGSPDIPVDDVRMVALRDEDLRSRYPAEPLERKYFTLSRNYYYSGDTCCCISGERGGWPGKPPGGRRTIYSVTTREHGTVTIWPESDVYGCRRLKKKKK